MVIINILHNPFGVPQNVIRYTSSSRTAFDQLIIKCEHGAQITLNVTYFNLEKNKEFFICLEKYITLSYNKTMNHRAGSSRHTLILIGHLKYQILYDVSVENT